MLHVPTEDEIRARAETLGLVPVADTEPLPAPVRRRVAKLISAELALAAEEPPAGPPSVLLSRYSYPTEAGLIQVDVSLIPTPKTKGPSNG